MFIPRSTPIAKRDLTISSQPIYVGIIIGISVLNIALLAACCLTVRRRRAQRRVKRKRISSPIACEMLETSPVFAAFTGAVHHPAKDASQAQLSYFQLIHSLQGKSATQQKPLSGIKVSKDRIRVSDIMLPPQNVKVPGAPTKRASTAQLGPSNPSYAAAPEANPPATSLRRAKSLDGETASMYSCVSAPLDFHEQLFRTRPLTLGASMLVSAPTWYANIPRSLLPAVPETAKSKYGDTSRSLTERASPICLLPDGEFSRYPSVTPADQPTPVIDTPAKVAVKPLTPLAPPVRARVSSDPSGAPPGVKWLPSNSDGHRPASCTPVTLHHLRSQSVVQLRPVAPLNVRRVIRSSSDSDPQPRSAPTPSSPRAPEIPARSARRPGMASSQTPTPMVAGHGD